MSAITVQDASVPHKSVPAKKGKVAYFQEKCLSSFASTLLVELAREMTSTDLAVQSAMYPSRPSVLVIGSNVDVHTSMMRHRGMDASAVPEVYGDQNSPHSSVWYNNSNFSMNDLLRSLWTMKPTGSYYLQVPPHVDDNVARRILVATRELFDVVLTANGSFYEADPSQVHRYRLFCNMFVSGHPKELPKDVPEEELKDCTTILRSDSTDLLDSYESDLKILWTEKNRHKGEHDALSRLMLQNVALDVLGGRGITIPSIKQTRLMKLMKSPSRLNFALIATGATLGIPGLSAFSALSGNAITPEQLIIAPMCGGIAGLWGILGSSLREIRKTKRDVQEAEKTITLPDFSYPESVISIQSALGNSSSTSNESRITEAEDASDAFLMPAQVVAKRHEKVLSAWLAYETDPVRLLEAPLLSDPSCPQTQDFYRAMRRAEEWADVVRQDGGYQDRYEAAVEQLEDAFEVAEKHAKKMGLSELTAHQRKKVKKASPFVQVAQNESAAPNERINAWRKATDMLEGVVSLPDKAVIGLLESRKR